MGKSHTKVEPSGKMKVRIIEFELEGSDTSLQESLKSITAAIARPTAIAGRPHQRLGTTVNSAAEFAGGTGEQVDDAEEIEEAEEVVVSIPTASKKPRRHAKVATPSLVDIRFDDATPKFAEFVAQKDPKNDMQKYLCAAFWLKTQKGINEVSVDHMYTAYKVMGWALPTFPVQPMRELAATRDKRFSKGVEKGKYAINHVGEGFVTTKMGDRQ